MAEVVAAAVAQAGKGQVAPYTDGGAVLTDRKAAEKADRKRFAFVNGIVKEVEKRKVLTRDKNFQDTIDTVLTNEYNLVSQVLETR